jgi:hypothetical protein
LPIWWQLDSELSDQYLYGGQPTAEEAAKIKAPLLLQYAGLDTRGTERDFLLMKLF